MSGDAHSFTLEMLPWKDEQLVRILLAAGIIGLLSIGLAVSGVFRPLFPVWAFVVFVVMVWGFLIRPYTFSGQDNFHNVLWLIGGALLAFLCSLTLFRRRVRR
jgi:hypothetical protein